MNEVPVPALRDLKKKKYACILNVPFFYLGCSHPLFPKTVINKSKLAVVCNLICPLSLSICFRTQFPNAEAFFFLWASIIKLHVSIILARIAIANYIKEVREVWFQQSLAFTDLPWNGLHPASSTCHYRTQRWGFTKTSMTSCSMAPLSSGWDIWEHTSLGHQYGGFWTKSRQGLVNFVPSFEPSLGCFMAVSGRQMKRVLANRWSFMIGKDKHVFVDG